MATIKYILCLMEHEFLKDYDFPLKPELYHLQAGGQTNDKSFLMVTDYRLVLGWEKNIPNQSTDYMSRYCQNAPDCIRKRCTFHW